MKVVWTPLAAERVADIACFIAQDNPDAAKQWVLHIFAAIAQLTHFPESGRHLAETGRADLRELVCKKYRVVYRLAARCVAILTVRHTSRILPLDDLDAAAPL